MSERIIVKSLQRISILLVLNLVVMVAGTIGLLFGLLPKFERLASSTERVQARFNNLADHTQPIAMEAEKALGDLKHLDKEALFKSATEKAADLMNAASGAFDGRTSGARE